MPGGGGAGGRSVADGASVPQPAPVTAAQVQRGRNGCRAWGLDEDVDARSAHGAHRAAIRGVLGTYPTTTRATPRAAGWAGCAPGRRMGQPATATSLPDRRLAERSRWPIQVHRAYRPREHMQWTWVRLDSMTPVSAGAIATPTPETGFQATRSSGLQRGRARPGRRGTSQTNVRRIETRLTRVSPRPLGRAPAAT